MITINPTKDTPIRWAFPDTNYGTQQYALFRNATEPNGGIAAALMEFDIPPMISMLSATLRLYYYYWEINDPVGRNLTIMRLRRADWVELEATWNIFKTANNWGTAGALNTTTDIDTALQDTQVIPAAWAWIEFDALALANDAKNNRSNKLLIRIYDSSALAVNFISGVYLREYAGAEKPQLVIDGVLAGANTVFF